MFGWIKYYLSEDDYIQDKSHFGTVLGYYHDNNIIVLLDRITMQELKVPRHLVIF